MYPRFLKAVALIAICFCVPLLHAQTTVQVDSVANLACERMESIETSGDEELLRAVYSQQFVPYLEQVDEAQQEKTSMQLFYRMQRNCESFRALLQRLDPPADSVSFKYQKPVANIKNRDLKAFKKQENFYYLESDGKTTQVSMKDGIWIDSFPDGSYSKLNYSWISKNEFVLEFISSDNRSRAMLSVPGDLYYYQVLAKMDTYYLMSVNIQGQNVYEEFRMYFD